MPAKSTSGSALEPVTGSADLLVWEAPRTDVPGVGVRVNVVGPTDTDGDGAGVPPGDVTLGVGVGVLGVGEDGHGIGDTKPPAEPVKP